MYSKNMQNFVGVVLIAVAAISSSIFAGGSIMVYNNSLYAVNVVVTINKTVNFCFGTYFYNR